MTELIKEKKPKSYKSENLSKRTYDYIKSKVVDGKYKPGEPILESSIGDELGISRTPVREALRLLEKENLVTIYPRRGAFITPISLDKIRDIYEIREIIEGEIAFLVTPYISQQKLNNIENRLIKIKQEFDKSDNASIEKAISVGQELHDLISFTLGNKTLIEFLEKIRFDMQRGCDFMSRKAENVIVFLNQHLEIINALKEKNADEAKRLLKNHIREAKESLI